MSEHFDAKLWGKSKREVLDELLTECTPENRHAEIDFGAHITEVKVKRLHPDAVIPVRAHSHDAGFDLVAVEDTVIEPGETALIKTGLAFELPSGYAMDIRPRSGISLRTKLRVNYGTVDAGYAGEVGVIVDNINHGNCLDDCEFEYSPLDITEDVASNSGHYPYGSYIIRAGDKIAQAVITKLPTVRITEVEELNESERGSNGYGSSGFSL